MEGQAGCTGQTEALLWPCQSVPEVDPAATVPRPQAQPKTSSSPYSAPPASYSAPQAPALSATGPITANSEQVCAHSWATRARCRVLVWSRQGGRGTGPSTLGTAGGWFGGQGGAGGEAPSPTGVSGGEAGLCLHKWARLQRLEAEEKVLLRPTFRPQRDPREPTPPRPQTGFVYRSLEPGL